MISLDVGVTNDGWVADAAMTVPVGPVSDEARKLLETTRASLFAGIAQARPGNHLGDISAAIQRRVEPEGFSSSAPSSATASAATCTRTRRSRTSASPARAPSSRRGWCSRSSRWSTSAPPRSAWATTAGPSTPQDGSLAAHFEFTVAVTADGPRILTPWHE